MRTWLAAAILISGCATSQPAEVASPRQLNEHAQEYDGRRIAVTGMLVLGTNGRSLYQSPERFAQGQEDFARPGFEDFAAYTDDCLTLVNVDGFLEKAALLNHRTVTLNGKFVAKFYGDQTLDLQKCDNSSAFVVDRGSLKRVLAQ